MLSAENRKLGVLTLLGALTLSGCGDSLDDVKMPDMPPPATAPADAPGRVNVIEKWRDAGSGVYLFRFDTDWPSSLQEFCNQNPNLSIVDISTADEGGYSHIESVLVLTAKKGADDPHASEVYSYPFNEDWPATYRNFVRDNPELRVTASFAAEEGGYSHIRKMIIVAERARGE